MGRRRKIVEEEQDDIVEESWDLKRVLIGFVTIVIIAVVGYKFLVGQITSGKTTQILGAFTQNDPVYEKHKQELINASQKDAEKLIEKVKSDVGKISADNLGSSNKDIEDIIQTLQALQGKSKQPADIVCDFVCKK